MEPLKIFTNQDIGIPNACWFIEYLSGVAHLTKEIKSTDIDPNTPTYFCSIHDYSYMLFLENLAYDNYDIYYFNKLEPTKEEKEECMFQNEEFFKNVAAVLENNGFQFCQKYAFATLVSIINFFDEYKEGQLVFIVPPNLFGRKAGVTAAEIITLVEYMKNQIIIAGNIPKINYMFHPCYDSPQDIAMPPEDYKPIWSAYR